MHRVELIAECPDDLIADVTKRIAMGDFPTTSMACKTPYDTCSVCGNVARTRNEYCPHLRSQLNKLFPDGKKVFAINNGPLTFFDISIVIRPADVNSSILQKVAYDGSTIGSAELAEIEGLTEESLLRKKAEFKKFSELIKEIGGGEVIGAGKNSEEILNRTHDLPRDLVEVLCEYDLPQVLVSMADLGISPSINFLSELIVRKHLGQGYDGIGQYVEEFVKTIPASESVPAIRFEEPTEINPSIKPLLVNNVIGSSLLPDYVEKRSMYQIPPSYASMSAQPRPRVSGVGYAGLGPYVEPTQKELDMEYAHSQEHEIGAEQSFFKDYSKLLTSVGVTALLAKFFITQMMYNRVKRKFDSELQHNQNGVKIVLVKQASDYSVAHSLSKIALDQSLPRPLESDSGLKTQVLSKGTSILRDKLIASRTNLGSKLGTLLHYVGIGAKLKSKIETKGN